MLSASSTRSCTCYSWLVRIWSTVLGTQLLFVNHDALIGPKVNLLNSRIPCFEGCTPHLDWLMNIIGNVQKKAKFPGAFCTSVSVNILSEDMLNPPQTAPTLHLTYSKNRHCAGDGAAPVSRWEWEIAHSAALGMHRAICLPLLFNCIVTSSNESLLWNGEIFKLQQSYSNNRIVRLSRYSRSESKGLHLLISSCSARLGDQF